MLEGRHTIVPKVERDVAKTVASPNGSGVTAYLESAKLVQADSQVAILTAECVGGVWNGSRVQSTSCALLPLRAACQGDLQECPPLRALTLTPWLAPHLTAAETSFASLGYTTAAGLYEKLYSQHCQILHAFNHKCGRTER